MQDKNLLVMKKINSFKTLKLIGKGGNGEVYLVEDVDDKIIPLKAMKMIKKTSKPSKITSEIIKAEVDILKKCQSQNILKFYEVRHTVNNYYIITEYCENGTLSDYIKKKTRLDEYQALFIFYQILMGFKVLHKIRTKDQIGAMHRDIKPQNILLDKNNVVKISDFGTTKICSSADSIKGTFRYMSPEMIGRQKYDSKVDIWALGLVLYEMLVGRYIFFEENIEEYIKKKILDSRCIQLKLLPLENKISEECFDLLEKMLKINPLERIEWKDLYCHCVFKKKLGQTLQNNNESSEISNVSSYHFMSEVNDESEVKYVNNLPPDDFDDIKDNNYLINKQEETISNNEESKECQQCYVEQDFKASCSLDSDPKFLNVECGSIHTYSDNPSKKKEEKLTILKDIYQFLDKLFNHMANIAMEGISICSNVYYTYGFIVFLKSFHVLLRSIHEKKTHIIYHISVSF